MSDFNPERSRLSKEPRGEALLDLLAAYDDLERRLADARAALRWATEWRPIETAPDGVWLFTHRAGEGGSAISMKRAHPDGDAEWIAPDGRTTTTHHTFLAPTHWLPLPAVKEDGT